MFSVEHMHYRVPTPRNTFTLHHQLDPMQHVRLIQAHQTYLSFATFVIVTNTHETCFDQCSGFLGR